MNDIYELLTPYVQSREYLDKMMHDIPNMSVVDRQGFIVDRCKGKRVINFGSSSGNLHKNISTVASSLFGADKAGDPDLRIDLDDDHYSLSMMPMADVYVCGEILEHLLAPGLFLRRLRWAMSAEGAEGCELIITVPNALCGTVKQLAEQGVEHVNGDHVAWYSYYTLKSLIERCAFTLKESYWYNGKPIFAEGLIFVVS
jgi:hypothetical protein